jgi:hypothetical protein
MELPDIYIIYAGDKYYPNGGAKDFVGVQNTKELAITLLEKHVKETEADWGHVFSLKEDRIVYHH